MAEFNYGGYGDGTTWSSERGTGPEPGSQSADNKSGQNGGPAGNSSPESQILAIQQDKNIKKKLTEMLLAARKLNPAAKMSLGSIFPSGMMQVCIEGITSAQAKQLGLGGFVMGYNASGQIGAVGYINTGHQLNYVGASIPKGEATVDDFVNGKPNGWHSITKDNWAVTGPIDITLINNAIKSARIISKGSMTGVLTPEEVMNKIEYKAMQHAFDALSLARQGPAARQIIAAWSLAWQDFPGSFKNEMERITERLADAINIALVMNQTASKLAESSKNANVAKQIINDISNTINDVNRKITEKRNQQTQLKTLINKKEKEVSDLKKLFKNHSYHPIQDAQKEYDDAQRKYSNLEKDINALKVQLSLLEGRKQQAINNKNAIEQSEKEALIKTSDIISATGESLSRYLGEKFKATAKEIANDIKNFQGKKIRTYEQAMSSLKKVLSNPSMKVSKADKTALINAWKSLNANDTANKFSNLSRAFKVADVALKIEKVREKSIVGYETGNWGPLMLEVESWVLSGIAVGVALGILGYVTPIIASTIGLPITAITIAGILAICYIASFIDDKMVDKINNVIIKPAR